MGLETKSISNYDSMLYTTIVSLKMSVVLFHF